MNSCRRQKRFQSFGEKATSGTRSSTKITRADVGTARRSSTETRSGPASSIAASRSETRRRAATGTERKTRKRDGLKSGTETEIETRTERGSERERETPTERGSGTNGGTGRKRESAIRMERRGGKVGRVSAVRYVSATTTLCSAETPPLTHHVCACRQGCRRSRRPKQVLRKRAGTNRRLQWVTTEIHDHFNPKAGSFFLIWYN